MYIFLVILYFSRERKFAVWAGKYELKMFVSNEAIHFALYSTELFSGWSKYFKA